MKKIYTAFIFWSLYTTVFAQAPLVKQWDKRYGGLNMDFFSSFALAKDGGYLLGGGSHSTFVPVVTGSGNVMDTTRGTMDYWIVKIDSLADLQWVHRYGGTDVDWLTSLELTSDGGYILGGYSYSDTSCDKTQPNRDTMLLTCDYWVIKIDSDGNEEWDKTFGGTGNEMLSMIKQTKDGGYILGGSSNSGITGDKTQSCWDTTWRVTDRNDFWIVKVDSVGNKQWDKRFGGVNYDALNSLLETPDGGYFLAGSSGSYNTGDKTQIGLDTFFLSLTFISIEATFG